MTQLTTQQSEALNNYKDGLGIATQYTINSQGYYCLYDSSNELIAIISSVLFNHVIGT